MTYFVKVTLYKRTSFLKLTLLSTKLSLASLLKMSILHILSNSSPGTQTLVVVTPVEVVAVDKLIWLSVTWAAVVAGWPAGVSCCAPVTTADGPPSPGPLCSKNRSWSLLAVAPPGPPPGPPAAAWPGRPAGPPVGGCERRACSWLTPAPPALVPLMPVLDEATEVEVTASVGVAIHLRN